MYTNPRERMRPLTVTRVDPATRKPVTIRYQPAGRAVQRRAALLEQGVRR